MIPKIINYCWFGGSSLPKLEKECIASWRKYCPEYEIVRWDESNFDVNQSEFCRSAYEARAWSFVSDYARLKIIYQNGGIYLDTDVELISSLDCLLDNECYVGIQQIDKKCNTGLGFGAIPHSDAVGEMLKAYDQIVFDSSRLDELACPSLNQAAIEKLGYHATDSVSTLKRLTVFPCKFFDPLSMGDDSTNLLCPETISIHHGAYSWGGTLIKIKRMMINRIGIKRVNLFKQKIKEWGK